MPKPEIKHLYNIAGDHWYRLVINASGEFQLLGLAPTIHFENTNHTEIINWQLITFPEMLLVWDIECEKESRYFLRNGLLHEYHQIFNIVPSELFTQDNNTDAINAILNRLNGFTFITQDGKQQGNWQFLQVYQNGKWTLLKDFSSFQDLDFIKNPTSLRQSFSPPVIPRTAPQQLDTWYEQRNDLPQFRTDEALSALELLPQITWQLDGLALGLLQFKRETETKEQYLLLLELLLGKKALVNELRQPIKFLELITKHKSIIRKPPLNFDRTDYINNIINRTQSANSDLSDNNFVEFTTEITAKIDKAISLYLLMLILQEYKNISGPDKLPFSIEIPKPSEEQDEQTVEILKRIRLYYNLLNHPNAVSTTDLAGVVLRLSDRASELPANHYNDVAYWIECAFSCTAHEAMRRLLSNLNWNVLEKFADEQSEFVIHLLEHPTTMQRNLLLKLALVHAPFAIALLDKPMLLELLSNKDRATVSIMNLQFTAPGLTREEIVQTVTPESIKNLAKWYDKMSLALLIPENKEIFLALNSKQIIQIACEHRTFALALLARPVFLQKFTINELYQIAIAHSSFALRLFARPLLWEKIYPSIAANKVIRKITYSAPLKLTQLAAEFPDFCERVIKHPELFARLNSNQLYTLFENHLEQLQLHIPDFALLTDQKQLEVAYQEMQNTPSKISAVSFAVLKTDITIALTAYNVQQYLKNYGDMVPDIFSQDCLKAILQSKNKQEIVTALQKEYQRISDMQPPLPPKSIFSASLPSPQMMWLSLYLKSAKDYEEAPAAGNVQDNHFQVNNFK